MGVKVHVNEDGTAAVEFQQPEKRNGTQTAAEEKSEPTQKKKLETHQTNKTSNLDNSANKPSIGLPRVRMELPTFDGNRLMSHPFWNSLLCLHRRLEWTIEDLRDIYLPTALTGPARTWYERQSPSWLSAILTEDALQKLFMKKYGIDAREKDCRRRSLLHITQKTDKTLSEYGSRFEELCKSANQPTNDADALAAFTDGLKDGRIRIQMERDMYTSFEELQADLRKWEGILRRPHLGEEDRPAKCRRINALEQRQAEPEEKRIPEKLQNIINQFA
uniref:Retrotransposon gag domain-containing protein n=1 Tax=Chromera velia CCMP2878 TaxID=1169474 RepID=A0A0G4GJJ4_9ALVE|eukprot:Cvel_22187.t1-p1 / transcript=Cvel_22187.t1 / gene=Cvel_22187 / organism=Chromera_velia_CCMP2878 / gene_product=hypothetical protein / transcript_product=hypothetical protein / location=Cvel_scaffold2155:345-1169(+) / protein_length=275 / sequence_SO=supercontig / SO=protein_coding / is_pseudo=false